MRPLDDEALPAQEISAPDIAAHRHGLIYHETRFRLPCTDVSWPAQFGLITAYATTGEVWSESRNELANSALEQVLIANGCWMTPITGYSPRTGHAEPGWAVELTFDQCCDLGEAFLQDAIYFIDQGELFVSPCAKGMRHLSSVAKFIERVDTTPLSP